MRVIWLGLRELSGVVWLMLGQAGGLCGYAGQIDPHELAGRVAATYRAIGSYDIDVHAAIESPMQQTSRLGDEVRYRLVVGRPETFRYEIIGPRRDSLVIISDGQVVWTYRSYLKQYTEHVLSSPEGANSRDIFLRAESMLLKRFGLLDQLEAKFKLLGEEDLRARGRKIRCAVLDVTPVSSDTWWKERLWISVDSGFIVKSVFHENRGAGGGMRVNQITTRVWTLERLGRVPDDSEFKFVVPRGVRRVETFHGRR